MKRLFTLLVFLFLALPLLPAQAQGEFIFEVERENIDESAVLMAAQPLLDRGAAVAVYLINGGEVADFDARLQAVGLQQGELVGDDVIAIYVAIDPNYSEIRYGDNWVEELNPVADSIRQTALNPNLREKQYERAFVLTLQRLETALATPITAVSTEAPNNQVFPTSTPFQYTYTPSPTDTSANNALMCLVIPIAIASFIWQLANGGNSNDGDYSSSPRYKSSWSSGRSSSRSSSSSSRSSGRSFGGGGRSGGGW